LRIYRISIKLYQCYGLLYIQVLVCGRSFGKGFALCYQPFRPLFVCLSVCPVCLSACPVCLSVPLVYCGQTVGWIKMKLGMWVGLHRSRPLCVRWGPSSPPPKRGRASSPNFRPITIVATGQTARWIRMPLGMEVGLGSGDVMLDGVAGCVAMAT